MNEEESFGPIILVVGRHDRIRSPILASELKIEQSRFDVKSAGIEPADRPVAQVVSLYEDQAGENQLRPLPISASLDDHLKLVVYVSESVKQDAPIIATPADKLTLGLEPLDESGGIESGTIEDYQDYVRQEWIPDVMEELPG